MPRKPRNSPNPPGKPRKDAEADEALEIARRSGVSLEGAAKRVDGVSARTLRRRRADRKAGLAPIAKATAAAPASPLGASQVASTAPDPLELARRIGQARQARAWAEIEVGLAVHTRGGEVELVAWLARPVEAVEIGVDELDALGRGLDLAVEIVERAEPGEAQLKALSQLTSLGKSVATVKARRPPSPKPDEVQEAIRARAATCVDRLLRHTRDAAAKLRRDRAGLLEGLDVGPALAAEIGRRIDAMLGAA